MLSEDFDKKIREAAQHHHPAYDERAWAGMKKQLDKHMPVEDDRRRRGLFFLLIFLLLGGAVALYQWGPFTKKEKSAPSSMLVNKQETPIPAPSPEKKQSSPAPAISLQNESAGLNEVPSTVILENRQLKNDGSNEVKLPEQVASGQNNPRSKRPATGVNQPTAVMHSVTRNNYQKNQPLSSSVKPGIKSSSGESGTSSLNKKSITAPASDIPAPPAAETASGKPAAEMKTTSVSAVQQSTQTVISNLPKTEEDKKKTEQTNQPVIARETQTEKVKEDKPKTLARKKSNFFFAVSAGPDVSFTSGDELGRMKMVGGFGLGYTYRGRITLRTGFYTGKKVYTASPANYKGSPQFYQYYPNLQKIDADCEVQEIPLNLSYHFGNKNNRPWFISAGLSSLIMKEETYNYFYRYNTTSPVISRSHSTYNQNKHIFSQLNLSAGYQLPLGKRFSVIAEPYLKLPMGGVGNGKVRLNSTGIMFTITANPFGKFSTPGSK